MWQQVHASVILLILTVTLSSTESISDRNPHWVKYNQDTNELPDDAIFGGYGLEPLFIARAPHKGSLTPGKFIPSEQRAVISWGGNSHAKYEFEILCGLDYEWISTTTDNIPDGAVVGGYMENTHEPLYVGRSDFFSQTIPGKVAKSHEAIFLAYENSEVKFRHFEILVAGDNKKPKITGSPYEVATIGQSVNISCSVLGGEPVPTISWQFRSNNNSTFVSVPGSDNTLNLSEVDATDAGTYKCVVTNDEGDNEHLTELIIQNKSNISAIINVPHWVMFNPDSDELPADAIVGGYQNETLYIASAINKRTLSPAMYVPSTHKAHATSPSSNDVHYKDVFQILCGRNYKWVPATTENIPNDAVVGGFTEVQFEPEYVGRTNYSGHIIPGKVSVSHNVLYFVYEGRTMTVKEFEILITPKTEDPIIIGKASKTVVRGHPVIIECKVPYNVSILTISWEFKPKQESTFMSILRHDKILYIERVKEPYAGTYKCIADYEIAKFVYFTEVAVQMPKTSVDPHWVPFNPDTDALPADAIVGGYENETLYIVKTPHEGSMNFGAYVPLENSTHITWRNGSHPKNLSEILLGDNYIWVQATTDHIPDRAFVASLIDNIENTHEPLYVCKANYSGYVIPGKVAVSYGGCHIAYGGITVPVRNFEVLVVPEKRVPIITGEKRVTVERGQNHSIECKVLEGVPKPTISWQYRSKHGSHFMLIPRYDNVLRMFEVLEPDAGTYKCIATNELGYSMHLTELVVKVTEIVNDYGIIHNVDLLKHMQGNVSQLKCGSGDFSEIITWFENGVSTETKGETYKLENVSTSFEGNNYTCRVINYNTHSEVHTFVLTISQLQFSIYLRDPVFLDLTGWEGFELNCDFDAKATPNISWTFNGKLMENQNSSRLTFVGNWGTYACKVTTIHGSIQRNFNITSSKCVIPRDSKYVNAAPIILTATSSWPVSDHTTDYMKAEPGQTLIFSCPNSENETNHLQTFPLRHEINANCVKEDQFEVKDKVYKLSDLVCAQEVPSGIVKKQEKCWTNTSELLGVGYGFSETYEVCFDTANNIPLYSHVKMFKSNDAGGVNVTYKWHKYPDVDEHRDSYTCDNPTSTCCYTKSQLVNARDVSAGPPQRTTFMDPLNAVPLWRRCNVTESPWEFLDETIRMFPSLSSNLSVWTGTYMPENINGTVIPRYLWKVVGRSLAIVYINSPSPTSRDILCNTILGYRRNTYLCQVEEFLHVLGLEGTSVGKASPEGTLENAEALLLF